MSGLSHNACMFLSFRHCTVILHPPPFSLVFLESFILPQSCVSHVPDNRFCDWCSGVRMLSKHKIFCIIHYIYICTRLCVWYIPLFLFTMLDEIKVYIHIFCNLCSAYFIFSPRYHVWHADRSKLRNDGGIVHEATHVLKVSMISPKYYSVFHQDLWCVEERNDCGRVQLFFNVIAFMVNHLTKLSNGISSILLLPCRALFPDQMLRQLSAVF